MVTPSPPLATNSAYAYDSWYKIDYIHCVLTGYKIEQNNEFEIFVRANIVVRNMIFVTKFKPNVTTMFFNRNNETYDYKV